MVRYQHHQTDPVHHDEKQDLKNCCKILLIALFGWAAIRVALIPFERGAFTPTNPALSHSSYRNASSTIHELDTKHQRVVLIVGSNIEALQQNLMEWTREAPPLQKQWSYPVPTREEFKAIHYKAPPRHVSFDPLFATIDNLKTYSEYKDIPMDQKMIQSVVFLYHNRAQKAWNEKRSLLVASKDAGHVMDHMDRWKEVLPNGNNVPVHVIIVYPRLRSQQVLQLWQEQQGSNKTTTSIADFIKSGSLTTYFSNYNPLGVAEAFVKRGVPTILVEEAGLDREGLDLSVAVSCFVLKVRCSSAGIAGIKDYHKTTIPKLVDVSVRLSESKMKEMEKILQDYDCGFYDLLSKSSSVHFLFREFLFESCSSLSRQYTAKEVVKRIEMILKSP